MKQHKLIWPLVLTLTSFSAISYTDIHNAHTEATTGMIKDTKMTAPKYLYKILSMENWQASQKNKSEKLFSAQASSTQVSSVQLSNEDHDFIHFSTEDQLVRIIKKYWANVPEYVVLKISTEKLPGKMVLEANPGGENKYYHLYDGYIPLDAIEEFKIVNP